MMWVLLQLESPWQRNDAITFFIYLCVSLYQEFFLRNRLGEFVHAIVASIMAKFEQILGERFRDILKKIYFFLLKVHVHMKLGNNASE